MQLIAMAMPKGDKGKQKSRTRSFFRSSDGSTNSHKRMEKQSPKEHFTHTYENMPDIDRTLPIGLPVIVQKNGSNSDISKDEGSRNLLLNSSESASQIYSVGPLDLLPIIQHSCFTKDDLSESQVFHKQDNECTNNITSKTGNILESSETIEHNCPCKNDKDYIKLLNADKHGDCGLSSDSVESHKKLLSIKSESIDAESGPSQVDEYMNLTGHCINYSGYPQLQSTSLWSKLGQNLDPTNAVLNSHVRESRSDINGENDIDESLSTHVVRSLEPLATQNAPNFWKLRTHGNGKILRYVSLSSVEGDFTNADSNCVFQHPISHDQTCTQVQNQSDYLNFRETLDPPMWTSVALKDTTNYCPLILEFPLINVFSHINNSFIHYELSPFSGLPNNECFSHRSEIPCEDHALFDTASDGEIPDFHVFQNCRSNATINVYGPFLLGNNNLGSDIPDYEGYDDNGECDTDSSISNFSIAVADLDWIIRMLPSSQIDVVFNQLVDEEVANTMYHHVDEDDDDEIDQELGFYDVLEVVVDTSRPANPVAWTLELGGNENLRVDQKARTDFTRRPICTARTVPGHAGRPVPIPCVEDLNNTQIFYYQEARKEF